MIYNTKTQKSKHVIYGSYYSLIILKICKHEEYKKKMQFNNEFVKNYIYKKNVVMIKEKYKLFQIKRRKI